MIIKPQSNKWIKVVFAFVAILLLYLAVSIIDRACNPSSYQKEKINRAFGEVVRQLNELDRAAK